MPLTVVAYFTNEKYHACAGRLMASLDAIGVEGVALDRPNLGSWEKNLLHKPEIIRTVMRALSNSDILYIDADAVLLQKPTLAIDPQEVDIMAYFPTGSVPAGGTIFVKNNPKSEAVMTRWRNYMEENPGLKSPGVAWDEACLADVLAEGRRRGLQVRKFPPSYCWIERSMRSSFPGATPVIAHDVIGSK
jgi:hypothetical protein